MFDIGFTEVTLIAVIGLLVIGPERLPRVAREIGLWVGRLRRYVAQVRADIEREVRADELRELVKKPTEELKEAIKETEKTIKDEEKKLESDLKDDEGTKSISGAGAAAKGEATGKTPKSGEAATRGTIPSEADPAADAAPEQASAATEQKEDEAGATALGGVAAPAANASGTASVAGEAPEDAVYAMKRDEEKAGETPAPAPSEDVGAQDATSASEHEKAGAPAREAS